MKKFGVFVDAFDDIPEITSRKIAATIESPSTNFCKRHTFMVKSELPYRYIPHF